MIRATDLLVVPYAAVRLPLSVVDTSVRALLPPGSRSRTVFDHGLGVLDHWAGLILDDRGIAHSGRARIARAGAFRPDLVTLPAAPSNGTTYATTRAVSAGPVVEVADGLAPCRG